MKILCYGDSITRGVTLNGTRLRIVKKTYPKQLQQLLPEAEVVNKGVFNDNSVSLLDRFEKDVASEQPNVVFIEIGGNDCVFDWQYVAEHPEDDHMPTVPLQTFTQNLVALCQKVQDIGAKPVLLNLPPLDAARYYTYLVGLVGPAISHWICKTGGIDSWHKQYSDVAEQLHRQYDIPLINVRDAFTAQDFKALISNDGIHPNEEGYTVMAQAVARFFK